MLARMESSGRIAQVNRHVIALAVGDDNVAVTVSVQVRDGNRDGV